MRSYRLALLYGFLAWFVYKTVSYILVKILTSPGFMVVLHRFVLITSDVSIPITINALVLVVCGVFLSNLYFRKLEVAFLKEGLILGAIWFAMSVGIDILLRTVLFAAVFKFSPTDAMYMVYPAITIGFGYLIRAREEIRTG